MSIEVRNLVKSFDVMQAPTLVISKNGKLEKIVNVSNIKKFIESR